MSDERNATAQWAHDMSNQRIRNLEAQLAERNLVVEQLQMALHVKHAQLTTITAERDNYRSKFRNLEHELQLERGQVVAQQQRAEAAEAEVKKLTAMLNGQERLAQRNAKEFDKAQEGVTYGVMVAASLYQQWQEATTRAEAAEAELADAYETVISLKRSEGYNERAEVERLTTLRPDSEYLRGQTATSSEGGVTDENHQ